MTQRRFLIPLAFLLLFIGTIWLLWVRPKPVDMAQFAPANALLYVEANQPAEVIRALASTDVWQLSNQNDAAALSVSSGWLQKLVRATGIGPIDSVILSRAQAAVVVTSFGTNELGDTLRVKPEAAIIIETHTSEWRTRGPVERRLERFVTTTYGTSQSERGVIDGVSIVEWRETTGSGRIVAAFLGTVVIIGNSRQVVEACLSVTRRGAPSLRTDPHLHNARVSNNAHNALVFGYVPAESSPTLVSTAIPILLGRAQADAQFQRLVQTSTSELIGGLTWTARPFRGGIEDRYEVTLQPDIVRELRSHFGSPVSISPPVLSTDASSISSYRLKDPLTAWQSLRRSISRRVDTVAAILLNTALRTSLTTYGIEDPENFLSAVKSPLMTVRLDQEGERQLLVATVSDRAKVMDVFRSTMRVTGKSADDSETTILENADGSLSVALNDSQVIIGHPIDVQQYYRGTREPTFEPNRSTRMTHFVDSETRAHVLTVTNDTDRVRACMIAVSRANRRENASELEVRMAELPYATTHTILAERGLTRITRSPLGQFSTVIPMLLPDRTQLKE